MRYESDLRSYTARNLIWDPATIADPLPYAIAAPSPLSLASGSPVVQFYRANWHDGRDFRLAANTIIRRMGVFCNFADGLVFQNPEVRPALVVRSAIYTLREIGSATLVDFAAGDTRITGTNFDLAFYGKDHDPTGGLPVAPALYDLYKATASGNGWTINHVYEYMGTSGYRDVTGMALTFFVDGEDIFTSNIYSLRDLSSTGAALSDFAYRGITGGKIYRLDYDSLYVSGYKSVIIPTLNCMYEYNGFYRSDIPTGIPITPATIPSTTILIGTLFTMTSSGAGFINQHTYRWDGSSFIDVTKVLLFNCNLEFIGSSSSFDLSTISVNTDFNGLYANFDSVIEVETTPG